MEDSSANRAAPPSVGLDQSFVYRQIAGAAAPRQLIAGSSCAVVQVAGSGLPEQHPAMSDSTQKISKRIEELQGAARKARVEAMQLAARLLTTSNAELSGAPTNAPRAGELAALRARYEGLVQIADQAQAQIDRLQAEEHERKYYR
jgi:hypothetical protein